jgi:UDP-N-acetylmuramoylalanine--D-glutamate ligase
MKRLVVLGAGESGLGAALLAKREGYAVFVSDGGNIGEARKMQLQTAGIEFEEGKHTEERIFAADLIIKSPGIPSTVAVVQQAMQKGIAVVDELEFASRYSKGKVIAITGTNGKTTTTLLTYHLLKEAGWDVGLAGNVGKSWAGQLLEGDHAWWVIEISSFQIDGLESLKPHIALLTNITPDHLDRYNYQMERYIDSKMALFKNMASEDFAILNLEDPFSKTGIDRAPIQATIYRISLDEKPSKGGFSEGESLVFEVAGTTATIQVADLTIQGKHNLLNALGAGVAALLAGLNEAQLLSGYQTFKNAAHRMELVRVLDGVRYINDSKGTNVEATFYALGSYKAPMIWIAGGVDKGNDYAVLTPLVGNGQVKALICLGTNNEKLKTAFAPHIAQIRETQDLRQAVAWAQELAEDQEVVLLSPACASFDLFKNYEDRGDQFKAAVAALLQKQSA